MPARRPSPTEQDRRRRVVLITGASSGIGRACAHQLSERGDALVLSSRSRPALEQVRQECLSRGAAEVFVAPVDVADGEAVETTVRDSVDLLGSVDGVIHSATVLAYGRFEDIPPEVFDRTMATNVTGTANVARSALRLFHEQEHGSLVVVGSLLGKIATPLMSTYCTGKWAQHGLTRILQIEARRTPGVEVSLVSPGGTDTPVYAQAGSYTGRPGQPPPPIASPEWVARRVVAALDRPVRDRDAGPANPVMVAGFRVLPGLYDLLVGPLMRVFGQGPATSPPGPGNVLEPHPAGEAVHGQWPTPFARTPGAPLSLRGTGTLRRLVTQAGRRSR